MTFAKHRCLHEWNGEPEFWECMDFGKWIVGNDLGDVVGVLGGDGVREGPRSSPALTKGPGFHGSGRGLRRRQWHR